MPQPGKTYSAKPSEIKAGWYIIDASGQTLGRLAANVAKVLRGKHKPMYTPHLNTGDDVVVKHPTYPFRHAVSGMLQHGTLGKEQLRHLKVYAGDAHPHKAQQPVPIRFGTKGDIEVIGR